MLGTHIRSITRLHWLSFFGLILIGWAILFRMAIPNEMRALESTYGAALFDLLCAPGAGTANLGTSFAMWALMSAAMMAPTALPAFATYDDLSHVTRIGFGKLIMGYLTAWLGFSAVAAIAQVALYRFGVIGSLGQSLSAGFTAILLIIAGAYQLSPLKEACLSRCRAPLTFFMQHWEEGPFRNGLRLGLDCVGCCWALMLLGFVGGTMNLAFMGLAMILMTLEKLPDIGRFLTKPLGWALIASGLLIPIL